jgi:uncharacterized protein YciI
MFYMFHCTDKAGSADIRLSNRPAHLAHLESLGERLIAAGPLLTEDGQGMIGSLVVVDCADAAEAQAVADADPYAQAGLFESVVIRPWRRVFPKA